MSLSQPQVRRNYTLYHSFIRIHFRFQVIDQYSNQDPILGSYRSDVQRTTNGIIRNKNNKFLLLRPM